MSNLDRSKKKKANTPLRSNFSEHSDEMQYKNQKIFIRKAEQNEIDADKDDDNNNENDDDSISDLKHLVYVLTDVIEKLNEHDQLEVYKKWCTLQKGNNFPSDDICYLLFLDLVTWLYQPITSGSKMR